MGLLRRHRGAGSLVAAAVVPLVVCAVLVPFRSSFTNTAAALVLVAVIVAVAVLGHRTSGVVATLSSCLWFDFFLTTPYERFAISHRPDIETTVSLFVVGLVVTELAARSRSHRRTAIEESDHVGLIYELAEMTARGAKPADVIDHAAGDLVSLLDLRACRYEPTGSARRRPRLGPGGELINAGLRWSVEDVGLPGPATELPVNCRGHQLGAFVLVPTPGTPISLERRIVALALADQVGGALAGHARIA